MGLFCETRMGRRGVGLLEFPARVMPPHIRRRCSLSAAWTSAAAARRRSRALVQRPSWPRSTANAAIALMSSRQLGLRDHRAARGESS